MASATTTRVVKGEGILHAHKVQYSKETHQLLKGNKLMIMKCWHVPSLKLSFVKKSSAVVVFHLTVLLQESKLSFLQQQQIQNFVHKGDSLPPLSSGRSIKSGVRASTGAALKKPIYHNKRTKGAIICSGAYERDSFVPIHPRGTNFTHVYVYHKSIFHVNLWLLISILLKLPILKSHKWIGRNTCSHILNLGTTWS